MSMTVEVAQLRIAREIQEAEASLDAALIKQANLLATMVTARRETGAAANEGHEVLLRLNRSQKALLSSGGELARIHARMLDIQEATTGIKDCPPNEPMKPFFSNSLVA